MITKKLMSRFIQLSGALHVARRGARPLPVLFAVTLVSIAGLYSPKSLADTCAVTTLDHKGYYGTSNDWHHHYYTIDDLHVITGVTTDNVSSCGPGEYGFTQGTNTFWTDDKCRGYFNISGVPDNCAACMMTLDTAPYGYEYHDGAHHDYPINFLNVITGIAPHTLKYCDSDEYGFSPNNNIFWTEGWCRGYFDITGIEAGCGVSESGDANGDTSGGTDTGGSGGSGSVSVSVDISSLPLFLGSEVEPNILFVIDDSGSMHYEITPDGYRYPGEGDVRYVFPRADDVYGSSDYTNNVPTVDDNNAYNALTRSPQINANYYDPSVTYTPWIKADGSHYSNASPGCAWHNPQNTGACPSGDVNGVARNLTISNSEYNSTHWVSCNSSGSCSSTTSDKSFWPATYFWLDAADEWNWDNYEKVEIRSTTASYTGHGRDKRTDCADAANATCTYAEEIQNFANWYTYYRSRVLGARGGVGRAFSELGSESRVGFGTINKGSTSVDGENTSTLIYGVRPFVGDARTNFYSQLYTRDIPAAGTPLRSALDNAGQYFSRTDERGPWSSTPGESGGEDISCRQNYTVLMTDGYWSGSIDSLGNQDGNNGSTLSAPDGTTYQYTHSGPFEDSYSNTLADVAMKYWKNDLRGDLDNDVPASSIDPAFWQHMVTFGVGFGVTGTVNDDDAFAAIDDESSIAWLNPDPDGNSDAKLDDLLHASVNGRGGFFSARNPSELAEGLSDTLTTIVDRARTSSTTTAVNSVTLSTDSYAYQGTLDSSDWSGDITAYSLSVVDNRLVKTEAWNASDEVPAHDNRNILSWNGSAGIDFLWNDLTTAQRAYLDNNENILEYIRGDQSHEQQSSGNLRNRDKLIGDIVNSDPVFVHVDNYGYRNLLQSAAGGGNTYTDFVSAKSQIPSMVYVGANDGMLHGFDGITGEEVFAYVPEAVFPNLASLSNPDYSHHFFVDGDTHVSDSYIGGAWKSVLLGATGAGGRAIFALDITDPSHMNSSDVLWEFNSSDDGDLGYTIGQAVIARLRGGTWAALFGNGYGSDNHKAQLFIVNLANGTLIKKIDTGVGTADAPNGLASPAFVYDSEGYARYVYAGDLYGNMWKFDLTDDSSDNWGVAFSGQPLFTAHNASGDIQPITVEPEVHYHDNGGYIVLFGTGKFFSSDDPSDMTVQSFYGVWDDGSPISATDRSTLQAQTITYEGTLANFDVRSVSQNPVDWSTKEGWYIDLVSPNGAEGERVVHPPKIWFDRVRFYTLIPSDNPCSAGVSGWLMELDYMSGKRLSYTLYDLNGDGNIDADDQITDENGNNIDPSGLGRRDNGQGVSPTVYDGKNREYLIDEGIGTVTNLSNIEGRKSWRQFIGD
jgi:type IV pilus assembly protein PilY1